MMSELKQQMAEEQDAIEKAGCAETLCTLLNNSICFMIEQGMSIDEIAEYLGCSSKMIDLISDDDFEAMFKEINEE